MNTLMKVFVFSCAMALLVACAKNPLDPSPSATPLLTEEPQAATELPQPSGTPAPEATPVSGSTTATPMAEACQPKSYGVHDAAAEWNVDNLEVEAPTGDDFLEAHDLTMGQVQYFVYPEDVDKDTKPTWEKALFVIELEEDQYGKVSVPLLEGYAYTVALCDGTVRTFWGGDPNVREVTLQWGLSARWVPAYLQDKASSWLSLENPEEWVTRENRFGRYRRSPESGLPNLPYFDRWGPYNTLSGNVLNWNPPSLDAVNATTYLEAAALLGGLAREDEWSRTDDGGWVWRYGQKEAGSGTYCPQGDPCWQTVYVPPSSRGCAILWMEAPKEISGGQRATNGGPYPFYAGDLAVLLDGDHQVDEFSYHPVSCPNP